MACVTSIEVLHRSVPGLSHRSALTPPFTRLKVNMLILTDMELKQLRDKAKSDIISAGHQDLFREPSFIAFWERFWPQFPNSPAHCLATSQGKIKITYVKQLGGIILGLYLAEEKT